MSKPLTGDFEGLCSACRGDYRVFIEVDESARTVLVVRIPHRAEAHRPPSHVDRLSEPEDCVAS